MEEIVIYRFQLEAIKEALRVTADIHNSRNLLETCHDRMVVKAEKYAENGLKGQKDKVVRFGNREPALNKPVVNDSLSFKEQMKQDIIPRIWQMCEEEKKHLNWLISNNAPKNMIEISQRYFNHFRQRHKEYIEYANGL